MKPAEPQATDIGAVNPVAETSPVEQPAVHPETDVRLLDLNKIVNSTYNPRKNFREDTLLELAESIRQSGVLQPICVRPRDEGFEIVYGERRYWAAAMAGLQFIPALIRGICGTFEAEDGDKIKIGAFPKEKAPKPTDKKSALLDIAVIIYSVVEFSDIFTEIIQPQHGGISAHII